MRGMVRNMDFSCLSLRDDPIGFVDSQERACREKYLIPKIN